MRRQNLDFLSRKADTIFIRELLREPLLEREIETELAIRWQKDKCEISLHQIIKAYSRLVLSIALKFRHYGLSMNDLIQEGNIGLLEAAQRFDPERQVRFSTYAKWWIRATMQDFVLRNWSIVRTGSTTAQKQLFFNLNRLKKELMKISQTLAPADERKSIATTLNVTIEEVEEMEARLSLHDLSINNPLTDEGTHSLEDRLMDEGPNPETLTIIEHDTALRHMWIEKALTMLPPREKDIIISRRLVEPAETLEAIGSRHKLSKERIRQIETKALRKMRTTLLSNFKKIQDII